MLRNYLKTAIRNLLRHRGFSTINVLGLSAGMSVCLLLIILIRDQNSYDGFHEKKDRIYRVLSDRTSSSSSSFATAPFPLFDELKDKHTGIDDIVRIKSEFGGDAQFGEKVLPISGIYSEPAFFRVFDFKLSIGDENTALADPFSIVLTEELLEKLDLSSANPIGKVIDFEDLGQFTITGVLAEPEGKSHLQFEALASFASVRPLEQSGALPEFSDAWWSTNDGFIYMVLNENTSPRDIAAVFPAISDVRYADRENFRLDFRLQSIASITPSEWALENDLVFTIPSNVLLFLSILALIVLLTAFFNYTNLSVARGLTRAKEVGVRKVVGASRKQIFSQFIVESMLVSVFSLFLAVGLLEIVIIPQFKNLFFSRFIDINLETNIQLLSIFVGFSLLVGLIAGLLPGTYLSAFRPAKVMKSLSSLKIFTKLGWRKFLIVTQFAVSLVFLITITVLYYQTKFMLEADYGFNRDNVVNVHLQGNDYEKVKSELSRHSGIGQISACSLIPAAGSNRSTYYKRPEMDDRMGTHSLSIDDQFISNMELELLAGRNFRTRSDSAVVEVMLNEKALVGLGWQHPAEAIDQSLLIDVFDSTFVAAQIVGVVKDFHYLQLERPIGNLLLRNDLSRMRYLNLKVHPENISSTISFIEDTWATIDPVHPVNYRFTDDAIGRIISVYVDMLKMLGFLAMIAIIITSLGLLGIATYSVETRTKEVGIRKVLGAEVSRIIWILSKGLFYPLLIAVGIALPAAWFLNQFWLEGIAYHIPLNVVNMGFGVVIILIISGIILIGQGFRIARRNPVDALRAE